MATFTDKFRPLISEDSSLVESIKKSPVKKIRRVYFDGDINALSEKKIDNQLVFNCLSGPLIFDFENGDAIGFDSEDTRDSIVCWHEIYKGVECDEYFFLRHCSKFLLQNDTYYSNPDFFKGIIGYKIETVTTYNFPLPISWRLIGDVRQKVIVLNSAANESLALTYLPSFPGTLSIVNPDQIHSKLLHEAIKMSF